MQKTDIEELIAKSQQDGAKLYEMADTLHKVALFSIALLGLAGMVGGFIVMSTQGFILGLCVLIFFGFLCFLMYAIDIILTNTSKVFVNILFSNLAMIQRDK